MSNPDFWRGLLIVTPIVLTFVAIRFHFLSRRARLELAKINRRTFESAAATEAAWADRVAGGRRKTVACGRLVAAGVPAWISYDEGPERKALLPYETEGLYNGTHPHGIRFGAFLGWPVAHAPALAEALVGLPAEEIARFGLVLIRHQAGGHHCQRFDALACPGAIADGRLEFARALCGHYYHFQGGHLSRINAASELADYRARLAEAGLAAERALAREGGDRDFMESVYPIDGDAKNVRRLFADGEALLARLAPLLRHAWLREGLTIYLIADNSD